MNINELDELANIWVICEDEQDSDYAKSFLELIAAYREAVSAIEKIQSEADLPTWFDSSLDSILATAKRLGV